MPLISTIAWAPFADKHKRYIKNALSNALNVAEGAIRSGKTIDHCIIAAMYLETCPDKIHLASGSSQPNAKLNIGECNGYGLEHLFRGRCHWGKFKSNEALFIRTQTGEKIVIFAGGGKADSYKKILGNSYGLWIATEINEHYDSDNSRESFIKVAFGRQAAARQPLTLWDLNPCAQHHPIYANYIDKWLGNYPGGYQYEHFTIDDNLSLTPERRAEIKGRYDESSVWYKRDILGQRVTAEGLIYFTYADSPQRFAVSDDELPKAKDKKAKDTAKEKKAYAFERINIGVDFGGSGSAHAMVATAFDAGYKNVYVLASERFDAREVTVETVIAKINTFAERICQTYGDIHAIYPDNAEQTIINSLRKSSRFRVIGCLKRPILERIRCTDILLSSGRLKLVDGYNKALDGALKTAVWNPKNITKDERLDDGTSDIDTLDAFEYSFEREIYKITKNKKQEDNQNDDRDDG
ncbi:MAG: PBSX family phage terminase large subunit [Eubacteriales bacterium]